jgi:transcriptional regulator with XRE-family HTH domain
MVLLDIRKSRQMTQRELSLASGIPQDVISSIETGKVKNPTWRTVRGLSKALNVAPEQLFPDAESAA